MRVREFIPWPLLAIGGLISIVAIGCAPAADSQIQADQFALRGMVASNQQQLDSEQAKIQRLEDRVSELEHNGSASAGGANQLASIEQRLNKLESQSNSQTGGASSAANPAATGESGPVPPGAATESSATGAAGVAGAGAAVAAPVNSGPAASTAGSSPPSWRALMDEELATAYDDPGDKLYHQGLVDLKANRYPEALNQFQNLQHRYPKSSLSESAEFFAANALYEMGKYDQAILQFNDQTMRFPKGRFASAALLREAQAFMKINDRIDARLTLQKLLSDLPDSPEAPMAKSMMQTLAS